MELGLAGKIVVVTGGSKGIGLACAQAFAAEGARVVLVSRSQENLDAARGTFAELVVAANLSRAEDASRMISQVEEQLGPIDVLVNSAGAAKRYAPADLTAQAWHEAMDAKFFSYIHPIDAVLPHMAARSSGVIVNIIGAGGKVASPVHLPGGSANAALMLATAGLAKAYAAQGIRINAINPGATLTDRLQGRITAEAHMTGASQEDVLARNAAEIPMGRMGTPEEVARVAVFLASGAASYVTRGHHPYGRRHGRSHLAAPFHQLAQLHDVAVAFPGRLGVLGDNGHRDVGLQHADRHVGLRLTVAAILLDKVVVALVHFPPLLIGMVARHQVVVAGIERAQGVPTVVGRGLRGGREREEKKQEQISHKIGLRGSTGGRLLSCSHYARLTHSPRASSSELCIHQPADAQFLKPGVPRSFGCAGPRAGE